MERALAMILAGGRGKRMDILCHLRPKPVLPFAGRFRVIGELNSARRRPGMTERFKKLGEANLTKLRTPQAADFETIKGAASVHPWFRATR